MARRRRPSPRRARPPGGKRARAPQAGLLTRTLLCARAAGGEDPPGGAGTRTVSWPLGTGGPLEAAAVEQEGALHWGRVAWGGGADCADELRLGPLFAARLAGGDVFSSDDCAIQRGPARPPGGSGLAASLRCPGGLVVEWSASLQELPRGMGSVIRTLAS
ncbi:unnamed protein product [Prorocentrum cordatum]|uniref:Altered inheritance of mitochondria protein 24, mitochondrial n=1 Tax=Prorocentrum cordatum TaxID=2364126 RepID=A0ABN9WV15_9DINO|nr:unnamed protein product [Polarella glacialis]